MNFFLAFTFNGCNVPGLMNLLDIAPNFSGTAMGIVNGCSSITGFIVPFVTAMMTSADPHDPTGWRLVFFSASVLYCLAVAGFFVFGTTKPQAFNFQGQEARSTGSDDEETGLLQEEDNTA